jgi:hypothetical protein
MLRSTVIPVFLFFILTASACATRRAPVFTSQKPAVLAASHSIDSVSSWVLDSLRPDEQTVLTEGRTVAVSIHMRASGNGHYIVRLEANKKRFRPFDIEIARGPGEDDFSGKMTWFVKARKRNEDVVVSVYRIEDDDAGKAQKTVLLKQFKRRYAVVCDKHKSAITLLIKKLFRLCRCKP